MQLGYGNSLIGQNRPRNSFVGALDGFTTDLAGAWSVARRLVTSYTGALIRVRRDSDSDELDIGYLANGSLNTAALLTFAGAGSAYVKTVYDQSGGGVDYVQATAGNQPRIVDTGTLETNEGIPAMRFIPGSGTYLTTNTTLTAIYLATSAKLSTNLPYCGLLTATTSNPFLGADSSASARYPYGVDYYVDGVDKTATQTPFGFDTHVFSTLQGGPNSLDLRWGLDRDFFGGRHFDGPAHEQVVYSANPSTSRTAIETALMNLLGL